MIQIFVKTFTRNKPIEAPMVLACSKRSDSGERCEVEGDWGERSLAHLSPSLAFIFSPSFLLRTAPHYLNAWNRLQWCLVELYSFISLFTKFAKRAK